MPKSPYIVFLGTDEWIHCKGLFIDGGIQMDTRKLVSLRIQQLCAAYGHNINSLAHQAGVPPTTVKNIIYGNSHNPGIVTVKLLCDGLGISLYDFFNTEQFKSTMPEDID